MDVDRCVCHEVSLAALKRLADELRARGQTPTADMLSDLTRAATGCGMCYPYIERMLDTGETRMAVIRAPHASRR